MHIEVGREQGAQLISFEGALDLEHALEARDLLLGCVDKAKDVRIDLSSVTYIDSSGLAALVQGFARARRSCARMVVVATNSQTLRAIQAARLERVFAGESVREAVLH